MRNDKQREKNVHCILTAKIIKELFNFRIQEQCQFSSNVLVVHERSLHIFWAKLSADFEYVRRMLVIDA